MYSIKYEIVEVIKEQTATTRGESIIRSIDYDTQAEAEARMKTMEPKDNGILKVKRVVHF